MDTVDKSDDTSYHRPTRFYDVSTRVIVCIVIIFSYILYTYFIATQWAQLTKATILVTIVQHDSMTFLHV